MHFRYKKSAESKEFEFKLRSSMVLALVNAVAVLVAFI